MADELQEIVDAVADLLGAPATLEDRDFHLVAHAAHPGTIDLVRQESILRKRSTVEVRNRFERYGIAGSTRPVRIPPDHEHGLLGRLCLPVRWNAVTFGYLWLLDDGETIGASRAAQAVPLCERAGLLMAHQARSRQDLQARLDDLLSPQPEVRTQAADELDSSGVLARDACTAVAVLRTSGAPEGAQLLNRWRLPRSVLTTVREQDTVLVVALRSADDLGPARSVADRARAMIAERQPEYGGAALAVGLSGACGGLAEVRQGWLRARAAVRSAAVHPPRAAEPAADSAAGAAPGVTPGVSQGVASRVREWDAIGVERLLWAAPDERLAESVCTAGVARLLAPGHRELTHSARVFLDSAGSVKETAQVLRVHRQTLYHRLHRIEQLTGLRLDRGQDRLLLHLALTLAPHIS